MLRIGICDDEELITKRLMRILYSLEKNQSENYDIEVYTDSVKLSEKLSAGKRYETLWTRTQKADRETGAADNK